MSNRLTQSERRHIVELLEREIYDLCANRLDPEKETYVGQAVLCLAEEMLEEAISAREKIARLAIGLKPLSLLVTGTKPAISSLRLADKLKEE